MLMAGGVLTLPGSWSSLSWQQLTGCWEVKMRYGGNADVARVAAMLFLLDLKAAGKGEQSGTGESVYLLKGGDGTLYAVTPRELSQMASQALRWFDYPYGDPGEKAEHDDKGKVVRERREPVAGYVGPMRDAMMLPEERVTAGRKVFSLPQVACVNLSWQQYRYLQGVAPQLFREGVSEDEVLLLQAQFLAHSLPLRSLALFDTDGGSIRIRPHWEFRYDADRAEGLVGFWQDRLRKDPGAAALFHIVFQCYQTAVAYYAVIYPDLFGGDSSSVMQDAVKGETGTVNAVKKYAGYSSQKQVYDSDLPFVLDILDTMAKEAKEIKRMNAKMKRR
jgi:hypothetical protein